MRDFCCPHKTSPSGDFGLNASQHETPKDQPLKETAVVTLILQEVCTVLLIPYITIFSIIICRARAVYSLYVDKELQGR